MSTKQLLIALLNAIEYIEEITGYERKFIVTNLLGIDEKLLKQLEEE